MASIYILSLSCPDKIGIVASVSTFLAVQRCNILSSAQFGDTSSRRFFLRIHFECPDDGPSYESLEQLFTGVAATFSMHWSLCDATGIARLVVMVSRLGHCLHDLLYRCATKAIPADIVAIISNHRDMAPVAEQYGIPYHYLPVTPENKTEQEDAASRLVTKAQGDAIILARYMQILSPAFVTRHEGTIINIHHSFLPSFKGASPYNQAFGRGVKLIGATAHYVTADLDEGPIIEQDVARVDHSAHPEELAAVGRDVECRVLARAVKAHVEHRILLNGHKTVVFS
ncbi:formyltetrahydrofolate deformylase [Deltaproteobacteria bacterium]|nr:formyltetrahydrofolate deformylase [Deltaproteobacteria bacterium]